MPKMMEVNPSELVEKVSGELEKEQEIKAPEWAAFVKTGRSKERPPVRQDWWHVRAAAVLRSVAKLGPIGVSKLRVKYGSKKKPRPQAGAFLQRIRQHCPRPASAT